MLVSYRLAPTNYCHKLVASKSVAYSDDDYRAGVFSMGGDDDHHIWNIAVETVPRAVFRCVVIYA